jgi:hypothetical protein
MSGKRAWREWCVRHPDLVHGALFFAFFVAASVAGMYDMPLAADNQHYFFIAERAASGVPPHVSQLDPKNALGMLVTAAAIVAGRLVGVDDLLASRVVSVFAGALAIALVGPLARRLTGSTIAAWVASIAMLSLNRFVLMAAMGSQPKVFLVLFVVASLLLVSLRRPALAGLAAGAAFLCWQPAAALVAAGALALLLGGAGKRAAASFVAAAVASFVAYEGYFLYHGVLVEQLTQAYLFPLQFMESAPTKLRPVLRRAAWVLGVSEGLTLWSLVPLLFVVWLVLLWSRSWRRSPDPAYSMTKRSDRIYFALASHAALANCLLSYQGFPDRFFLDPFMAISSGWLIAGGLARFEAGPVAVKTRRGVAALSLVALSLLAALGHWDYRYLRGLHAQRKLGEAVGKLLDAGFGVYAVGCTHLLAFNHVDNFTPYGFFFRGVAESLQVGTGGRGYRPLRDGKMPDVILISRGTYLREQPWFEAEYARAKRDDFGNQSVQVWLRVRRGSGSVSRDIPAISADSP